MLRHILGTLVSHGFLWISRIRKKQIYPSFVKGKNAGEGWEEEKRVFWNKNFKILQNTLI